ncbi:exocyst complex component Sec3-domain-containing protein [Phellopilus nigrolimitatus]|nr:exocyst complex component Sec3-domain-containing protein [Phellopilus nigrolimitatus]
MSDHESAVKNRIIESVFTKRNAAGDGAEETYIAHLKIWEIEGGNDKPRYIILSKTSNGSPLIHKSRVNPNGTFSVGKTWKVVDLRAIEIPNPLEINISFARSYVWQTESQKDQDRFFSTLVALFRDSLGPNAPLRISGFTPSTPSRPSTRVDRADLRSVKSNATIKEARSTSRANGSQRAASPSPRSRSRAPATSGRPGSPAGSSRSGGRNMSPTRASGGTRPSSPAMSAMNYTPARKPGSRRPSNATNASVRSFDSNSTNQLPSIVIPPVNPTPVPVSRMKDPSPLRSKPIQVQAQTQAQAFSASRSSLDVPFTSSPLPSSNAGASTVSVAMSNGSGAGSSSGSPISSNLPSEFPPSTSSLRMRSDSAAPRAPSPTQSSTSRRSQRSRAPSPSSMPTTRVTKLPSGQLSQSQSQGSGRRDPNARISFFDTANQALLDRLLFSTDTSTPSSSSVAANAEGTHDDGEHEEGVWEEEGDTAAATLANIEEMLEGYEWIGDGLPSRARKGPSEQMESQLLDELLLLDRANIYSLLESDDDRIVKVLKGLDEAIAELDGMEQTVSSYKIHLNAVSDDILYIQSQNRGLQVQTQNQQLLLNELEKLLQTVHVDRESLITLTQESLEKDDGIAKLEAAAIELYKALLAGRDNDMAATMERLEEYRTHNSQFCKRMLDFLTIMFTAQGNILLGDSSGLNPSNEKGRFVIRDHLPLETYLGRYCGLMLYMKEMDENRYSKICAAYFSAASDLHAKQIKAFLASYEKFIRQASEEEIEQAFASNSAKENLVTGGLRRAGTVVRNPLDAKKEKGKRPGGKLKPFEVLDIVLEQVAPQVHRERMFIADFLLINDSAITYADYVALDHYFRRQAERYAGLSNMTTKLVRGAMDLIFGFLPTELKTFIDGALAKDNIQIPGAIAAIERAIADAEARENPFFAGVLDKQHQRLKGIFDRHVDEQIKGVEQTRLDAKKRRGVAHFIRYFPVYVARIESQLAGAEELEIRDNVDAAYDRIVQSMFDSLKQMAKMDGEQGEEKGQLNYHVILIENMHHFIAEMSQSNINAVNAFKKRAEAIYDENLSAYVKIVMRRSFSKIIDYFEGIDRMLKTTAPTEVSKNASYGRSALKRVVKEYNSKDVRKNIDALFKRVEKHFTDADAPESAGGISAGTAMADVWKACEHELLRMTDFFGKHIGQCYKDTGVGLEYSSADVEASFKRHM